MNPTFLYLAIVYSLTILLIRRLDVNLKWRVGAFFYLLVVVFLFKPLVGPYVAFGADYYYRIFPWVGTGKSFAGSNVELNDIPLQFAPWAHLVRESLRNFEFPLWNATAGSGYPLLANGQSSALSPLRWLGLPLSLGHSLTFEAALKILIALTFAYLYLRRRFSESAAIIGSLAFGFGGFMTVWLLFPHTAVAAFLPALFYALDRMIERRSYSSFVLLTFVFALLLLNGHPETAAHSVFAAGCYVGFWALVPFDWKKWRTLAWICAAGLLAIVIALPFVLPFVEALPRAFRNEVVEILGNPIWRRDIRFLVPLIQPSFYGTIREGLLWGPGMGEFTSSFAGIAAVVGWLALLPSLRTTLRNERAFFLLAVPCFASVALGWPPLADAVHAIPPFSKAANGRFSLIVCWFLAILLADFVDHLRDRKRALYGIALAGAALMALFFLNRFPSATRFDHALVTSIPAALVLLALLITVLTERRRGTVVVVLAAAIGFDLWAFSRRWNQPVPEHYLSASTPLLRELQKRARDPREAPFRVAGTISTFFPNTSALYGIEDIRVHDPMANARYMGLLRVVLHLETRQYVAMLKEVDHSLIDYLNVGYVVTHPTDRTIGQRFVKVYAGKDGNLWQNRKVLHRFFAIRNVINEWDDVKRTDLIMANDDWTNTAFVKRLPTKLFHTASRDVLSHHEPDERLARVRITSAKARRYDLEVDAPRWTLIVSSVPHWPGWRAYDDQGDEIKVIEVNELFIGFLAPPGQTKVRVVYRPRSFYVGMWISLVTIAALIAWPIARKIRVRRVTAGLISLY